MKKEASMFNYEDYTKEQLLKEIKIMVDRDALALGRNSMGCCETWYDPFWAITQVFEYEELEKMTRDEIFHLLCMANMVGDGLY